MYNDNRDYVDISKGRPVDVSFRSDLSSHSSSHTKKSDAKKKLMTIRIVCIALSLLFLIGGSVCLYGYATINSFNFQDLNPVTVDPTDAAGEDQEQDLSFNNAGSGDLLSDPYVLNVMLFGEDQAAGSGSYGRSDTMILLSIDNRHEKIKMTSFLRDTYVNIPGEGYQKLNYSYSVGGAKLAIQTIEANYGIQIDRYAIVNFSTFKSIVDILGGVDIEVTDEEIRYINAQIAHNNQTEYLDATAGVVTLNGQQALWYARNRGGTYGGETFSGDDWDRTDRQRKFLEAVINNVKNEASLPEIIRIVNSIGPKVTTNLKKTEIQSLVANSMTYLTYDIVQCSMPSQGTWSYGYNEAGSVILVDNWNGARRDLATFIYEDLVTTSSN